MPVVTVTFTERMGPQPIHSVLQSVSDQNGNSVAIELNFGRLSRHNDRSVDITCKQTLIDSNNSVVLLLIDRERPFIGIYMWYIL